MAMEERVVLLVAPALMHDTSDYTAAVKLTEERHPNQRIVLDKELWTTSKEFLQTYKQRLDSFVVTDFYILTAPDGTVGNGIFRMWRRLSKYQVSRTRALFPTGEAGIFEEIDGCELSVISKDTARYAVPVFGTAAVPT